MSISRPSPRSASAASMSASARTAAPSSRRAPSIRTSPFSSARTSCAQMRDWLAECGVRRQSLDAPRHRGAAVLPRSVGQRDRALLREWLQGRRPAAEGAAARSRHGRRYRRAALRHGSGRASAPTAVIASAAKQSPGRLLRRPWRLAMTAFFRKSSAISPRPLHRGSDWVRRRGVNLAAEHRAPEATSMADFVSSDAGARRVYAQTRMNVWFAIWAIAMRCFRQR